MNHRLLFLTVAVLGLSACGSEDAISIDGAWSRATADGQTRGAVYLDITAAADDTLVAVGVPAEIARAAEIHEVMSGDMGDDAMGDDATGDDGMEDDGMGDDGMGEGDMAMVMQEMEGGLPLPAGETVSLEPGSFHIMLLDVAEPLVVGDEFEVTLQFENADDVALTVEVAESAP